MGMGQTFFPLVYLRLQRQRVRLLDVRSGREIDDIPQLVLGQNAQGRKVVQAVGRAASATALPANCQLVNGFDHPRVLIADFAIAEATLKFFLKMLYEKNLFKIAPKIVVHPLDNFEGGLSTLEWRALRELCMGAGARQVILWSGPELSAEQILSHHWNRAFEVVLE